MIIVIAVSIMKYPEISWSILQSSPDKNTLLGDSQDRLTRSLIGYSPWENSNPIGRERCGSTYACSGYFSASNYLVLNILWESPVSLQWQFLLVPCRDNLFLILTWLTGYNQPLPPANLIRAYIIKKIIIIIN